MWRRRRRRNVSLIIPHFFLFLFPCTSELKGSVRSAEIRGQIGERKKNSCTGKMGACSLVSKYGCVLATGKQRKNEVRATDLCVCACVRPERKTRPRCENNRANLWPQVGSRRDDTSNSVQAPVSLLPAAQRCPHTYLSGLSRGKNLMHIHPSPSYFTCHGQFITHLCAHTHTHSQNEQQRPLMSRNAHRSVKQHDSCRSRGPPSLVGCCPQPTVAPQSDNGTPGFSRHGCVNTVQRRTGEKNNGENVAGGRQERKKKHFLLFSPDYFCCLTLHESRRGTVEEHYQWKGMK